MSNKRKQPENDIEISFDDVFGIDSILGPSNSSIKVEGSDQYNAIQMKIARLLLLFRMTNCQICELRCFGRIKPSLTLIKIRKNGVLYSVKPNSYKTDYSNMQEVVAAIYTCDLCAKTLKDETFKASEFRKDLPESLYEFVNTSGKCLLKRQETLLKKVKQI